MKTLHLLIDHRAVRRLAITSSIVIRCRSALSLICKHSRIFASTWKDRRLTTVAPYSANSPRTRSVTRVYLWANRWLVEIKYRIRALLTGTYHRSEAITNQIHQHLGRLQERKAIQTTKIKARGTLKSLLERFTRQRLKSHQNSQTITAVTTCNVLIVSERRTAGLRSCMGASLLQCATTNHQLTTINKCQRPSKRIKLRSRWFQKQGSLVQILRP